MSTVWQQKKNGKVKFAVPEEMISWAMTSWSGGGGDLGAWLENVQMAGRNGGVLIACLQISHRPPPTLQSAEEPGSRGAPSLSTGPINHGNAPGRMSAPMLFVWILELDCAVNRLFMFLSLSHVFRWLGNGNSHPAPDYTAWRTSSNKSATAGKDLKQH